MMDDVKIEIGYVLPKERWNECIVNEWKSERNDEE